MQTNELIFVKSLSCYIFKHTFEEVNEHNSTGFMRKTLKSRSTPKPTRFEKSYLIAMDDYEDGVITPSLAEYLLTTKQYKKASNSHIIKLITSKNEDDWDAWFKVHVFAGWGKEAWIGKRVISKEGPYFDHVQTTIVFASSLEKLEAILRLI